MTNKYFSEIEKVEEAKGVECVPSDKYMRTIREAYRWTFSEISNPQNFLPRALINDNPRIEKSKMKCEGWSLSFYDTEENALNKFNSYRKNKPNIDKKLGTHLAKGILEESDGYCGKVNRDGHFEFFESINCDLSTKFEIISKL